MILMWIEVICQIHILKHYLYVAVVPGSCLTPSKYVILAALLGELVTIRLNDNDIWCVLSVGKS
jgi:hypothetical protein